MPVDADKILGDLYPEVDKRLRTDRKGNPLELAVDVSQGNLTETEIRDMIDHSGVGKEYDGLPDEAKQQVNRGLHALWLLNRVGQTIEEKDLEIIGQGGFRKRIEEDLDAVRIRFHGGVNQYLPESVNSLVRLAQEKDPEKQSRYRGSAVALPEDYILRLRYNGREYQRLPTVLNIGDSLRERIEKYLEGGRKSDIGIMEGELGKIRTVASILGTSNPTEK